MVSVERLIGETTRQILLNWQPPAKAYPFPSAPLAGGPQQVRRNAMAYGHRIRAFIENGPVEQVAKADAQRSTARAWRTLDQARRLRLVECALGAANDRIDGFPIAL
jgi:hypothetical protein